MRNLRLALALSAVVLLTSAPGAGASIYWLNDVGAASTIGRSANDGSSPSQSFIGPLNVSEPEACGAMAIDAGHLYWSDYTDASATATSVGRAARNGTGATSALVKAGATMSCGVAVDGSHIYWADRLGNSIGRANLDGSAANDKVITGASDPWGVAVDDRHIYWSNRAAGAIGRANLDGSQPSQTFITGLFSPHGIAVDGSHIYWANDQAGPPAGRSIGRASIGGSGVQVDFIPGAVRPHGVAIDGSHVYWANWGNGTVGRANLDGTSPSQAIVTGASEPAGITVDPSPPAVATGLASGVTPSTAMLTGTIDPQRDAVSSCRFDYGTTTALGSSVACAQLPAGLIGAKNVAAGLSGLGAGATYYYRVVGSTAAGTTNGTIRSFTTGNPPPPPPPLVSTGAAAPQTDGSVTLQGSIDPRGSALSDCHFDWGPTGSYGHSVPCDETPSELFGAQPASALLTGLTPGTTYHFRLVARNIGGSIAGADHTFTVPTPPPDVVTESAAPVWYSSATLHGSVAPHGASVSDCHFDYGTTISYGSSVPCETDDGSTPGTQRVDAFVGGLPPSTSYHFRLVAATAAGTRFGVDETFRTAFACPLDPTGHIVGQKLEVGTFELPAQLQVQAVGDACWTYLGEDGNHAHTWFTSGPVVINGLVLTPVSCAGLIVSDAERVSADPGYFNCDTRYDIQVPADNGQLNTIGRVDLAEHPLIPGDLLGPGTLWGSFQASPYGPKFGSGGITGGEIYIPFRTEGQAYVVAHLPLPHFVSTTPFGGPPPTADLTYYTGGAATGGDNQASTDCNSAPSLCGGGACGCNTYKPPTCAPNHVCPSPTRFTAGDRPRRAQIARTAARGAAFDLGYQHYHLDLPSMSLGGLEIKHAFLDYNPDARPEFGGLWSGGGDLGIGGYELSAKPPPPDRGVGIFGNGDFAFGGAALQAPGPGIPIFTGVFLKELGITFGLKPTRFTGDVTVNVANVLSIHGGVLVVYANSSYPYSYPPAPCDDNPDACPLPGVPHLQADTFRRPIENFAAGVSGTVNLAVPALGNVPLASAYIFYINNPSYFEFAGHVNLDQLKIADIKGDVHGALDLNRGLYDIDASVHACLGWTKISACQDVSGHMSNLGIGACTHVLAFNPGFRYEWGDGLTVFLLGCDDGMGPITENVYNGRTADAAAATGVNLPPGLPSETFWVKGSGAPPAVSVTGPHGEHASGGAGPDATIDTGKIVIMPLASQHETVVALRHPSVGHWTVTPQPGSAVKAIAHADGLHPARVRVAVGGRGRTRTLAYHVGPRPGQNVTFAERAGKVFHVIGGARGTSGLLHFKPAFGPGGPREIVAMISLQGVPSKALVVGHYRAPATPRAAKPPRLRVQRRARAFVVSWGLAANARSYLVQAMLGDGRRVAIPVSAGRRSVSIPAAGRAIGAKISVTGVGIDGNPGLTAVLRLKPPPPPARVRAIRTRVTRSGVVVSWHAVPSAVSYMVRIVIRSRPAREFLLFAPKPRLKPSRALLTLKRGQSAAIEIRAVARNGRVGRAGRGRYVARRR